MKKAYQKPMVFAERYSMTQSIAACSGIKIKDIPGQSGDQDVLADPDATPIMKDWAMIGGFLSHIGCSMPLEGSGENGFCYHTSANAAFNS